MSNWGIAETATPKEKIKSEMSDYLNGLNSAGDISYEMYDKLWDFTMKMLDKMYELESKGE